MKEMNDNVDVRLLWDEEKELEKAHNYDVKKAEEKGSKKRNMEIAKNMKEKDLNIELISEVTGLTKKEIEAIK